jgi:hypothetical protein
MTNINTFQGDVFIHEYIKHTGDDNNLFGFSGTDTFKIATAGVDAIKVDASQNVDITGVIRHIGDENNLFGFSGTDTFKIATAGTDRLTVNSSGAVAVAGTLTAGAFAADNVDSGTFADARIPDLNTSKLTAGTLGTARGGTGTTAVTGTGSLVKATAPIFSGVFMDDYMYHTGDVNNYFGFPANDQFLIATSGTTRMKVLSNGLTAIGNHTPTRTLDVNGTCNFRGTAYSPRFTSYYHTTGSISTITTYDISVQGQFLSSVTGSGTNLDTGWYLLSAQRGDGNPFESGSAHFYVHTSGPQRMTTFGQGGISFSTTGQNIRLTSSQNAANYPTPYAIHLCKVGNTYATGI